MAVKNNLLLKIALSVVALLIVALFTAGGFYVLTGYRLTAVEIKAGKIEEDIDYYEVSQDLLEDDVALIQYDIRHIKEQLTKQEELGETRHNELLMEIRK